MIKGISLTRPGLLTEYLRMMFLARQPEALQDLTEALGVYDNRELLDKEHMYKRFNPQVLSCHILIRTSLNLFAILGCQPCLDLGIQSFMNILEMSSENPFQWKIVL
jgi:hypothetical protein